MANHYTLLTHSPPRTHSFLTAVPGQTPLPLLNNMCRWPFVLQAAGRLLVHTFSQRELRGIRVIDGLQTLEKCNSNFVIFSEHVEVTRAEVKLCKS